MEELYEKAAGLTSTLAYVNELQEEIAENYRSFVDNIEAKYNVVEKRRQRGEKE